MLLPAERVIDYDHLQTPAEHLAVLVEPAPARLRELVQSSAAARCDQAAWLDTTIGALRRSLRQRLELAAPVIAAGHQPEFFHAGVLAKNFAVHELAATFGGRGVFLLVDSDLPKSKQLILPQLTPGGVRRIAAEIPGCDLKRPYETQPRTPREHWLQFFARCAAIYPLYDRSLFRTFAYGWLTGDGAEMTYSTAWSRGHEACLTALGIDGLATVTMSALSATPEFRAFAGQLMLRAAELREHYNAAQAAYRERHRVRAPGRPVPPLAQHGDAVELPFWLARGDGPRQRAFVELRGPVAALRAESDVIAELPVTDLATNAFHVKPWSCESAGWHIRPRALALSAFMRLFVADVFIHGIGGAKYDEVTADFLTRLLGVPPRPIACASATLHLPLPRHGTQPDELDAARHAARDIRFNPQRHVPHPPAELVHARADLVRQSDALRAHHPDDHEARRVVFRELRRVNEQLLATDQWKPAEFDRRVEQLEQHLALDRVALDREYFFALHPQDALHALVEAMRAALAGD